MSLTNRLLFRADLADATGDVSVAQRWRNAAKALWGRGDPEARAALNSGKR